MWYVCDVLYAVLYAPVNCFVVRGCIVSMMYINVCNSDVFSVVNMYLYHLKFGAVCINGRNYVCCSECYVVSSEYDEPTPCLVRPIGAHCDKVMKLGFLNCDDICMCVVNKQFGLLVFVFNSFLC